MTQAVAGAVRAIRAGRRRHEPTRETSKYAAGPGFGVHLCGIDVRGRAVLHFRFRCRLALARFFRALVGRRARHLRFELNGDWPCW